MSRAPHAPRSSRPLRLAALAVVPVVAVALAACSSSSDASTEPTSSDAASSLAGTEFTVAVQSAWPPIGFMDGDTLQGVAIDVAGELGDRLGVTFTFEKPAFADMIPGVQSGKYDFGLWGADVTADRMKIVDQVSWMKSGYYLEAPAGSGIEAGVDLQGVCGMTIALVQGQTTQPVLEAASQQCVDDGKGAITLSTFPDQPTSELAVTSGRADVATVGSQTFGYTSTLNPGQWEAVSDLIKPVLNGMVFPQGSEIAPIISEAINDMIADGTYAEILDKWHVSDSAIDESEVNPAL